MVSALAVVLGVMLAGLWAVRKLMKKSGTGVDDGQKIRVLSTRYLGPKSSIMLVDVLGSVIVVGVTASQISMLTTITDEESIESLKIIPGRGRGPAGLPRPDHPVQAEAENPEPGGLTTDKEP